MVHVARSFGRLDGSAGVDRVLINVRHYEFEGREKIAHFLAKLPSVVDVLGIVRIVARKTMPLYLCDSLDDLGALFGQYGKAFSFCRSQIVEMRHHPPPLLDARAARARASA